jgi:hypothetical protein
MLDTTVYFLCLEGVHGVQLSPLFARHIARRFPHEWSLTGEFARPPASWRPSRRAGFERGILQFAPCVGEGC